jgi:hypothetical protein
MAVDVEAAAAPGGVVPGKDVKAGGELEKGEGCCPPLPLLLLLTTASDRSRMSTRTWAAAADRRASSSWV